MNLGGWIFVVVSWGLILTITVLCFWMVLKKK
jgi:hypothetical protein